ncbi:hypothetical protein [Membranihabitans marinus]|uniref:hypothetical protein n=1 Tax=Membranihabitans marinus TaxID=1227546 RepID=UPI001F3CDAF9|nr:hypothetical protein [Membranihabitans marinus]
MKELVKNFQDHFPRFKDMLLEAQNIILNSEVSDFPVFVFSKTEPEIGIGLYSSKDFDRDWNVHASSLEELVAKNVIVDSKIEEFKDVYKDPSSFFCILLLDQANAQFAFPPINDIPFSDN